MSSPKISVIMPVYNGMPHLKHAVKSVLNQTYKNLELIIVDDASTDGTAYFLKGIADKRVKIVINSKNSGIASSLNEAIKRSKADYIARMDADDISLPNRLEKQLNFLQKNPKIDICGAWAILIDENDKIVGEKKLPLTHLEIKRKLFFSPQLIHPTWVIRKKVFEEIGGYDKEFEFAEDYEFLIRAKNYKMANIPFKLLKWRVWSQRRSQKNMKRMDILDLKIKINYIKKENFPVYYLFIILKKAVFTYLFPYKLKLLIARQLKLS